jgi:hypothetical protein
MRWPTRGIGLQLLVNRDALAEPARHLVGRELERDHVAELVPQHGLPVDRAALVGRRAVGGDHAPETHAEVARIVGHAEGAHAEILLLGKDLTRASAA